MIKEQFFPTFVYAKDIKINNEELANYLMTLANQDKGVQKTNVGGWHSKDLDKHPSLIPLVDELHLMQREIYKEEYIEREPILGNIWANINYPNCYNEFHLHPNCLFSGVYYVKAPTESGKLVLTDPRAGAQSALPIRSNKDIPKEFWRDIFLEPIEGRIIMFPAWVWHRVGVNKTNDPRISLSFNFIQQGFNVQ
tara:strand:- start:10879 stop:11463 length:585 start_codon:yes stop_codon:yes gene_type:complete